MLARLYLRLQCLVLIYNTAISYAQSVTDPKNFVDISAPADPITWRSRLTVKYICTVDKLVGVTLRVSTVLNQDQYRKAFQKLWRCRGNEHSPTLKIRRIRVQLTDDIAFRPSLLNKHSVSVEAAKIVVWMVDDTNWKNANDEQKHRIHKWALNRKSYDVHIQPPYSRPYKRFKRSCVPWFWTLLETPRLSDAGVCSLEQLEVSLLSFPAVFNGQIYGILRTVSPFSEPLFELERAKLFLSPRFSVELWVYFLDYCPQDHLNTAKACLLFGHVTATDVHLTPCILVDSSGYIQIEGAGPDLYVAYKTDLTIPRYQWVRILFSVHHRTWTLQWSFGKHHNITYKMQNKFHSDVFFGDTEGLFLLGGADARLGSFLGYMSRVRLYRNLVLTLNQLTMPKATDPMFQLDTNQTEGHCQQFRQWVHLRINYYSHKAANYFARYFCPNSYRQVLTGHLKDPQLVTCSQRPGSVGKDKKLVAQLLRLAALRNGHVSTNDEAAIAQRLLDTVTDSIEEQGMKDIHHSIPLLEQSACLGNMDATFTLAAFLNNGVGTTVQEYKSLALLMHGVLHRHRISTLALAHRHMMGIDGVPVDKDMAYMYYKDVGDKSKDDREDHREDQVSTEKIRLMDEEALKQQTDESGDLFMWLKHQAQQGVTSAQSHLAHLYFWGSQGMRRNLQAARHLFQQGAEQGDADSIYNLGIMDLLGSGGSSKNETAGKERLKRAAEEKHPYAISALGWIALETEKNYTKAAAHFEEAFKLNFMDAGYYLGHMYQNGFYPNKSRDIDIAVSYYEWAALRGHAIAALLFAYFQSKGTAVKPRNPYLATEWARFIAEQNTAVGKLLREGVHSYRRHNIPLASYYYLLSSEAGIEVASFNLAWLCEEFKEDVASAIGKECQWRHYNLTLQREDQFIDPYSYIKMGDYFWYGCQGQRDMNLAARYYAAAGKKMEPLALFNLAFMVEEGIAIPVSVWESLKLSPKHYSNNVTLLLELYDRCRDSRKSEAFVPCSLAFYRVWLLHLWNKYHIYFKTSTILGTAVAVVGTICLLYRYLMRFHYPHLQLYHL